MAGPEDDADDTGLDTVELDAAERALGTLPRIPGAIVEGLDEARARRDWETRLAPLAGLVAPVDPPAGLLGRIMDRIGQDESARALVRERRRAARWRGAALGLAAAAAALAIVAFVDRPAPVPQLVSVATGEAGAPALVISVAEDGGWASVRPVSLQDPEGGSLELWHIPTGGAPVSLGVIDPAAPIEVSFRAAPGDLAAVSLEPAGGSPTGQPTGPVLYSGPFLALR